MKRAFKRKRSQKREHAELSTHERLRLVHAYIQDAGIYNRAAGILADQGGPTGLNHFPAHCFLWCHAIELSFKAFLILKGWSPDKCKSDLGHNLQKGMEQVKAINSSLSFSDCTETVVAMLSELHAKDYTFRYRPQGPYEFPNLDLTRKAAHDVVSRMEQLVIRTSRERDD